MDDYKEAVVRFWTDKNFLVPAFTDGVKTVMGKSKELAAGVAIAAAAQFVGAANSVSAVPNEVNFTQLDATSFAHPALKRIDAITERIKARKIEFPSEAIAEMANRAAASVAANRKQDASEWATKLLRNAEAAA